MKVNLLVVLLVLVSVSTSYSANLIQNGDFENDLTGWELVTDYPYEGNDFDVDVTLRGLSAYTSWNYQICQDVSIGTVDTASTMVKTVSANATVAVQLIYTNSAALVLHTTSSTDWELFDFTASVTDGLEKVCFSGYETQGDVGTWYDDVAITENDVAQEVCYSSSDMDIEYTVGHTDGTNSVVIPECVQDYTASDLNVEYADGYASGVASVEIPECPTVEPTVLAVTETVEVVTEIPEEYCSTGNATSYDAGYAQALADANNGHGNDLDGVDESNPGRGWSRYNAETGRLAVTNVIFGDVVFEVELQMTGNGSTMDILSITQVGVVADFE